MKYQKSNRCPRVNIVIWFFLNITLLLLLGLEVKAQSESGSWSGPINLSRSSGTSEPVSVTDNSGRTHVIWKDLSGAFYYSQEFAGVWSEPTVIEPPFGSRSNDPDLTEFQATPLYSPILTSDREGGIHALWIDRNETLSYSFVESKDFSETEAWSSPQQLAGPANATDIVVDDDGRIHVVHLRPAESEEFPAGLYYQQSDDLGLTWTPPHLLYESSYLRILPSSDVSVEIVTTGPDTIAVVWDNRPLERVFYVSSTNAGNSWDPIMEVDRRLNSDGVDSLGPQDIQIGLKEDEIHLVWLAGHEGRHCVLYHQLSRDLGQTWESSSRFPDVFTGCPQPLQFFATSEGTLLLAVESEGDLFVTGWDGNKWNDPVEQSKLSTIINPETYRAIEGSCHDFVVSHDSANRREPLVIVIACEAATRGDIWASTMGASQLVERVQPLDPPTWQSAKTVSQVRNPQSPILLSDGDGFLHAVWTDIDTPEQIQRTIQYSRWNGSEWSQSQKILSSPDGTNAAGVNVLNDSSGNLLVAWSGGLPGDIFYSRNSIPRANSPEDWTQPVTIPVLRRTATSPDLAVDSAGTVFIAYALSLNENRGIYLTTSDDGGEFWQEADQVFDAASVNWEKVDSPQIMASADDTLHMIWRRYSSPPSSDPISIHYARSEDAGKNWSEPITLSESPAIWTQMLTVDEQTIHIIWQTESNELWYLFSADKGHTWNPAQRIEGFVRTKGQVAATLDGASQPQLVQINDLVADDNEQHLASSELRHWTWSGNQWLTQDSLELDLLGTGDLDIAATTSGKLGLVFLGETEGPIGEPPKLGLNFTNRNLDLPSIQATPLPTVTPTSLPNATLTATPTVLPTATIEFPTNQNDGQTLPLPVVVSNPFTGSLFGVLAAGIVIVVVFFFGVRILRGDRRRR